MSADFKHIFLGAALSAFVTMTAHAEDKVLHVYNWSDYIAEDTIPIFEQRTGIKVVYDVFDSSEVLEAKLMAGSTGFDIVVPTATPFLERQIIAGIYQPLDKSKLPNYDNLDKTLMKKLETIDPGNQYAIPYMWGTTGIGYNVAKVRAILGDDAPVDSWELVYNPDNLEKLSSCGVAFLDAPAEILPTLLHYLGKNPNSENITDYSEAALTQLMKLRPYITYFHSSQYINDLANGDICVAVGWSGDILQAADRAAEAGEGVEIAYRIPKEGTIVWFDMMAIPKDAPHAENALAFLNYLMEPDVIANASNYIAYANGNAASKPLIDKSVTSNPGIYPPDDMKEKLFMTKVLPPKVDRVATRTWTKVKTGQ